VTGGEKYRRGGAGFAHMLRRLFLATMVLVTACGAPQRRVADRSASLRLAADWEGALGEIRAALAVTGLSDDERAGLLIERATIERERGSYQQHDQSAAAVKTLSEAEPLLARATPATRAAFAEERGWQVYFAAFGGKGTFDDAMPYFTQAQAYRDESRDVRAQARAWFEIGLVHQQSGRVAEAEAAFTRGLAIAEANQLLVELGYLERHVGAIWSEGRNDLARAIPHFERSLELRERGGHRWGVIFACLALADVVAPTDPARARDLLERAATLGEELRVPKGTAYAHESLALLDPPAACAHLAAARDAWRTYGDIDAVASVDQRMTEASCSSADR